ncbi:MFS transporter [Microbacterium maritypicum]|uniref:MFS transporter n=1 Tax=Microbacterium maritypicum TaxID=33918 RepID=UPI002671AF9F|nr:MFS transporter [Microbacterium liquefaciens]WKT87705.1 MFS transporter [Microbacterium liquefaciens]
MYPVVAGGILSAMTFPGQTAGLSVFADPLIEQLGIDRSMLSLSYLIGTLLGAAAQPVLGHLLDRFDARRIIVVIAVIFSGVLFALSFAQEIVGLTAGYVGVRMFGQGALGLAATTAVAQIVRRRRGLALGVGGAIGSAGISLAPVLLERVVSEVGIATAWRLEALAVLVVVVPIALTLPRPAPVSTEVQRTPTGTIIVAGYTAQQARRTGMFWVLTGALSTSAMLSTALGFHQIGLLGERGLTPLEAAANFIPQTITALAATLLVGALIDRYDPRIFVVGSMAAMAASMLLVGIVTPGILAVIYGLVLGLAGGALRGMEAAAFVRYYGLTHIGSIRGLAVSISLAASALGPYALAVGAEWAGNFSQPSAWLAIIPAGIAIFAFAVPQPTSKVTRSA